MSAQTEDLPAGRRVPDAHRLVFAAGSQEPAVSAEGHALDVSLVGRVSGVKIKATEDLAGRRIRQFYGPVEAGRS